MFKPTPLSALLLLTLSGCANDPLLDIVTTDSAKVNKITHSTTAALYDITTFDAYADKGTVHILAGGKAAKTDKLLTLHYLSSGDGGVTWGKPAALGKNLPAAIATRGNDAQLAAHGEQILALWQSKGELPGMGPLNTAFSDDGGSTWTPGVNPALNNQGDQSHADVLADNQGNFHAVWLEDPEENGYQSLRYARLNTAAMTWSKPATLDDSTCSCCWNTLALSANNTLNILYRDMKPRDMALLQSSNNGSSWQRTSTVGEFGWQFDGCPHVGGGLASVPGQPTQLHSLVWTGAEGKAGLYYLRSTDSGKTWSLPQAMGKQAIHADIAAVDTGHIAAVWDELKPEGNVVYLSASEDGGNRWQTPVQLSASEVDASHPRLIGTSNGFLALWTEKSSKQPMRLAWRVVKTQ